MPKELRIILKGESGVSFPLMIGVTLPLLLISCGISEYFRLQIIATGVRDTVEDAIVPTVSGNYARVYHGVREEYSGGYTPYGEGEWEETPDERGVYARIDKVLGTGKNGGRYTKFAGDSESAIEFALTDSNTTPRNMPLMPLSPGDAQCFGAGAVIRLEVPIRSGRKLPPSIHITLRVQAGYTEVFQKNSGRAREPSRLLGDDVVCVVHKKKSSMTSNRW